MEIMKTYDRYAIFQQGLKQYQAVEGKTLALDRLAGEPGQKVEFTEVLFRKNGEGTFEVGQPFLKASVTVSILKHTKGVKTLGMRFKRRKKLTTVNNGRASLTIVRIESI
jgi:large subunit ribosomal protein L21